MTMKPSYLVYCFASAWREAVIKMFKRLLGAVLAIAAALTLLVCVPCVLAQENCAPATSAIVVSSVPPCAQAEKIDDVT